MLAFITKSERLYLFLLKQPSTYSIDLAKHFRPFWSIIGAILGSFHHFWAILDIFCVFGWYLCVIWVVFVYFGGICVWMIWFCLVWLQRSASILLVYKRSRSFQTMSCAWTPWRSSKSYWRQDDSLKARRLMIIYPCFHVHDSIFNTNIFFPLLLIKNIVFTMQINDNNISVLFCYSISDTASRTHPKLWRICRNAHIGSCKQRF